MRLPQQPLSESDDVVAWLDSPDSDKWRRQNFRPLYLLLTIKDQHSGSMLDDYWDFLWLGEHTTGDDEL